jgi:hypothetical protein
VAPGASDVCGRIREARVPVEAAPRSQAEEDLARAPLQPPLHLDGVVARVEDEKRDGLYFFEPTQQCLHLPCGDHVSVLGWSNTLHVHGGGPTLAGKAQLCDELVGPACNDGLAGGVAGWMVVETALGTALSIAPGPHAGVHGVDGRLPFGTGERMVGQELP